MISYNWAFLSVPTFVYQTLGIFCKHVENILTRHDSLKKKCYSKYPSWFNGKLAFALKPEHENSTRGLIIPTTSIYSNICVLDSNIFLYKSYINRIETNTLQIHQHFDPFSNSKRSTVTSPICNRQSLHTSNESVHSLLIKIFLHRSTIVFQLCST